MNRFDICQILVYTALFILCCGSLLATIYGQTMDDFIGTNLTDIGNDVILPIPKHDNHVDTTNLAPAICCKQFES